MVAVVPIPERIHEPAGTVAPLGPELEPCLRLAGRGGQLDEEHLAARGGQAAQVHASYGGREMADDLGVPEIDPQVAGQQIADRQQEQLTDGQTHLVVDGRAADAVVVDIRTADLKTQGPGVLVIAEDDGPHQAIAYEGCREVVRRDAPPAGVLPGQEGGPVDGGAETVVDGGHARSLAAGSGLTMSSRRHGYIQKPQT